MDNSSSHKHIDDGILDSFLKAFRLDSRHWQIIDFDIDQGSVPCFSDDSPDDPIIETTTDCLRDFDMGSMTVHISMRHGRRFICQDCGTLQKVHKWIDTDYSCPPILFMRTKVRIKVPQLYCPCCSKYRKARCPLVVPNHSYTRLTKFEVACVGMSQTVRSTSESCRIGEGIVSEIIHDIVEEGKAERDLSNVTTLFMDEIQSTSGHNYVTMVADQDHRLICGVLGHDADSVKAVRDDIASCGCDIDSIRLISVDMSTGYKAGVKEHFPKSKTILDRFHIVKMVNESVDKVRKRTNRELKADGLDYPKNVKYTVLYRESNHDERNRARMDEVRLLNPDLARAFDLKEEFCCFFEASNKRTARSLFFRWYNRVKGSHIPEMIDVARRLFKRLNDILRWFDNRLSNGVAEGMNSVYKRIKADAYGFKKPDNLIDFCLFRKGCLNVSI